VAVPVAGIHVSASKPMKDVAGQTKADSDEEAFRSAFVMR
jgi:hypothetical protein